MHLRSRDGLDDAARRGAVNHLTQRLIAIPELRFESPKCRTWTQTLPIVDRFWSATLTAR